jgi:hypothetical protein
LEDPLLPNLRQAAPLRNSWWETYASRPQTHASARPWWETYGREEAYSASGQKDQEVQFDLVDSNRLARHGHQTEASATRFSPRRWAFPLRPDGGRKDCKVTRVVEMECALGALPGDGPRRLSHVVLTDESVNLARHPSTHAAITHPRREVAIQA